MKVLIKQILSPINHKIPQKFKSKKTIIIVIILVLLGFIITRGSSNQEAIKLDSAKIQNILSEVVASGKITSNTNLSLNFATSGKVTWVPVKEGDYIQKGQIIATLDKELYEIALRQAQQDLVAADALLLQLYDVQKEVVHENYNEKVARTAAEKTKNQAFDAVKLAERNLKNATLTAPAAGTVTELNIIPGEEVLYTEIVAKISDVESIIFEAEIDETDIGKVIVGQKSIITLDAFDEEEIESTVDNISLIGVTNSTDATAFEVKFSLPENEKYRLGMNGDITIILEEKQNVLTVPIEAIIEDNYVWAKVDGKYSKREVIIGLESDLEVEIVSGINEDQKVVIDGFEEIGKKSLLQKILRI